MRTSVLSDHSQKFSQFLTYARKLSDDRPLSRALFCVVCLLSLIFIKPQTTTLLGISAPPPCWESVPGKKHWCAIYILFRKHTYLKFVDGSPLHTLLYYHHHSPKFQLPCLYTLIPTWSNTFSTWYFEHFKKVFVFVFSGHLI